jgi:hypothetical protein
MRRPCLTLGAATMKRLRRSSILTVLMAASGACCAAQAAGPATAPTAAAASQGLPKVCLDVQTRDELTQSFADRLRETIAASGALSLASAAASCDLKLHVPGNLLRFETAGGVMVGTVVIVTSRSDRYLSTSVAACQASDLGPCAVGAVAAAKLALLVGPRGGT